MLSDFPVPSGLEPEVVPLQRRRRLWEIPSNMYCGILGTCLGFGELVKIGRKAGVVPSKDATDYEVHAWFVQRLGRPSQLTRLLQKRLDKAHRASIDECRDVGNVAELEHFWSRSLAASNISGPFWALVTHPLANEDLRSRAYGDIHMLSHWMGSANREVLRRAQSAEARQERLTERLAEATRRLVRQEDEHGRESDRQACRIRELRNRVEEAEQDAASLPVLEARLRVFEQGEIYRSLERENATVAAELSETKRDLDARERKCARLEHEVSELRRLHKETSRWLAQVEVERAALEAVLSTDEDTRAPVIDLRGRRIAYVGGREGAVRHFRALIERFNGSFSHHDGGVEDAVARLDRILHQADVVLCPIDCVSHGACLRAKKFCKRTAKTFVPLRSASLSCMVAGLHQAIDDTGTQARQKPLLHTRYGDRVDRMGRNEGRWSTGSTNPG